MSKPKLTSEIQGEISRKGAIPFARFMELALYHPDHGYYNSPGEKIGWKGDFYTSSSVHPVFGELLAKQLMQMAESLGNKSFIIVEVGAGKGTLCHDILNQIKKENVPLFTRLKYIIVEGSPDLKKRQINWLSPLFPHQLSWCTSIPQQLNGIVFSNELLDAFPVHRLRVEKDGIQEIFVDWKEGRFMEILKSPSTPRLQTYLDRLGVCFQKPVELEINLNALDWIESAGNALSKGYVITIDYGYAAADLYTSRRPKGTFLCYHKHQANETPYEHIGEQDMTAHVDFTSLVDHGRGMGLRSIGFTDQMRFLMGLGIADRMEIPARTMFESETARQDFLAMKQLMSPDGMGRTFKVLIQGKNVPTGVALDGLQFKSSDLGKR